MSSDLKLKSLLIYVRDIMIESAKKSLKNTDWLETNQKVAYTCFVTKGKKLNFKFT